MRPQSTKDSAIRRRFVSFFLFQERFFRLPVVIIRVPDSQTVDRFDFWFFHAISLRLPDESTDAQKPARAKSRNVS